MSDPRNLEGDTNPMRDRYVDGRGSEKSGGVGWVVALVIAAIVLGAAAYAYRDGQMTSSNPPETTSGQSTRAPAPSTPPSAPVAPAPAKPTPSEDNSTAPNPAAPASPAPRAQ